MAPDGAEQVLDPLDPEQRQVALAPPGPVCVLAGAGTGKTRAIAHRIAYAVRTGAVDPAHVLALTFTTRAAGELRERLRRLGGPGGGGMERAQARTFHSAALRQLKHFWPAVVGGPPPALLDTKVGLLAEAAHSLGVRAGLPELRDVAAEVEWAKVTQVQPDDYPAAAASAGRTPPLDADVTARLYGGYEGLRRQRHLADFESVLELTAAILAEHRGAAAEVADRYRYFVVDEYQDVNPLQKLLLDAWLAGRDQVCVVGDPRQTIYSFTGATPAFLTGFAAEFPHARVVRLMRSYRSSPQVVALANRLTGAGPGGRAPHARTGAGRRGTAGSGGGGGGPAGPPLVAQRPGGPEPRLAGYADDTVEAVEVAGLARALIADGVPAGEIAVLVRTNTQTERFERALAGAGVAFCVRGTDRFFDRPEVRQAMGTLRAAAKSARPRLPATTGLPGAAAGAAAAGVSAVEEVTHVLAGLGLTLRPPAGRGSARDRWESLAALAQIAEDFCVTAPEAGFADVVAALAGRAAAEHAPAPTGVTVTSLHAAKGLEWEAVFVPGLSEGNLPIVHAQTGEAVAEERRLLYVGLTRARSHLFLSWAAARSPGGRRVRKPSRFLDGLMPLASRSRAGARKTALNPGAGQAGLDRYGAAVPALCAWPPAGESGESRT